MAKQKERWVLWAETTEEGVQFYDQAPIIERPPREAERSPDGNWATLWVEGKPVKTWMKCLI